MQTNQATYEYDVIIMGAGFAGICQARHLQLNIPGIKIALIDPRPADRQDKDMKVGESMVELAALFVSRSLGLHDYMLEKHAPKQGLNFHWKKDPYASSSLDDYYHVWINRQVAINTFHLNRAVFERDVLQMVIKAGAKSIRGTVIDVDLPVGDAPNSVYVRTAEGDMILNAKHVVDAAGRNFIIGRKRDNTISGKENLSGLNNGSVWMRFRGVDRTIFHDGYDPHASTTSRYYATNHWFGPGHWVWMIPTDTRSMELSVGMVYHHDVIASERINTREKFLNFLKANHKLLHDTISSGEVVDFVSWPQIAHRSKRMFSNDNWYVLGDAAYVFDGFYSYGTSTIALAAESITEIIRSKFAAEAAANEKCELYDKFNVAYAKSVNAIITHHDKQLGNASAMSWRIYFEYMWWFGLHVPMYFGKWHLDKEFINTFVKVLEKNIAPNGLFQNIYQTLNEVVDKERNIGLMDVVRGDQLWKGYTPARHFDSFLENAKTEPRMCNVFVGLKSTCFFAAIWYIKLQWKARGITGVTHPTNIYHALRLFGLAGYAAIGNQIYRFKTRKLPSNSVVAAMRKDFESYRYRPQLAQSPKLAESPPRSLARPLHSQVTEVDTALI